MSSANPARGGRGTSVITGIGAVADVEPGEAGCAQLGTHQLSIRLPPQVAVVREHLGDHNGSGGEPHHIFHREDISEIDEQRLRFVRVRTKTRRGERTMADVTSDPPAAALSNETGR
jgi:hypothetical protein